MYIDFSTPPLDQTELGLQTCHSSSFRPRQRGGEVTVEGLSSKDRGEESSIPETIEFRMYQESWVRDLPPTRSIDDDVFFTIPDLHIKGV